MPQAPQLDPYQIRTSPAEVMPRKVTPYMSPDSAAPGLGAFGAALDNKLRADGMTYAANQLSDMRVRQNKAFIDGQANAKPDGSGFTQDYVNQFDKDAQSLGQAAKGNRYAESAVEAGIRQMRADGAIKAQGWEAEQGVNFRADSVKQNTDKIASVIEADPSQREAAMAPVVDSINTSGFQPHIRLALMKEATNSADLAAARGFARMNPSDVLGEINKPTGEGDLGEILSHLQPAQREAIRGLAGQRAAQMTGDGVVDTYRQLGPQKGSLAFASIDKADLPPEIKDAARQHVEAGLTQMEAEGKQTNSASLIPLEERIGSGQPAAGDRGLVMGMYQKGVFGPQETAAKLAAIDRSQLKGTVDDTNRRFVEEAYGQGRALDPESADVKSGMAAAFNAHYGQLQGGSPQWINGAASFAARTGVLPEPAVSWSRAQLVGGSPDKAAAAAETLTRLLDASSRGAPFAIDEKTTALASEIIRMKKAGTDPVTAVTLARENANPSPPEKQRLDEAYKKLSPSLSADDMLRRQLASDTTYKPGFFSSVPERPSAILAEFNDLQHQYFLHTNGNMLQASQLAAEDIKRSWGVSDVNGSRQLMKFAPELMYPGLTAQHIRTDIALVVADMKQPDGTPIDPDRVQLRERRGETASTRGQIWTLAAPDKFGAYDVLLDKNHESLRYTLPVGQSDQEAIRAKQVADNLARTRATQKIQNDSKDMSELIEEGRQRSALMAPGVR